eukprot:gene37585-20273_t
MNYLSTLTRLYLSTLPRLYTSPWHYIGPLPPGAQVRITVPPDDADEQLPFAAAAADDHS